MLRRLRGLKRMVQRWSSTLRRTPSIQPKLRAWSSASWYVMPFSWPPRL
jgi:hypothetical protein